MLQLWQFGTYLVLIFCSLKAYKVLDLYPISISKKSFFRTKRLLQKKNWWNFWNLWGKEIQIDTSHVTIGLQTSKLDTSLTDSLKLRMVIRQLVSLLDRGLVFKNCIAEKISRHANVETHHTVWELTQFRDALCAQLHMTQQI